MVDVDTPPNFSRLPEPFIGALRELARTKKLLVALDFDGTLAPEVDDPEQVVLVVEVDVGEEDLPATLHVHHVGAVDHDLGEALVLDERPQRTQGLEVARHLLGGASVGGRGGHGCWCAPAVDR